MDTNLGPGERILHRTKIHWITLTQFPALLLFLVIAAFAAGAAGLPGATGVAFILLLIFGIAELTAYMRYATSEFAITDRRVIIKVGWIGRRSLELLLSKIESVAVEQGLEGRLFDFGTIVVMGTGGTREPFRGIRAPIEFRNRVQTQIAALRTTPGGESLP